MKHVAPHLWADAAAGRLTPAACLRLETHAAACPRCAAARTRVTGAQAAFTEIAATPAPDLRWDHIGARIYWVTSSERRATLRMKAIPVRRNWRLVAGLGLAGAAAAAWLVYGALADRSGSTVAGTAAEEAAPSGGGDRAAPAAGGADDITPIDLVEVDGPAAPAAAPLSGVVTFAQGEVTVDAGALAFDRLIVAGETIATGEGGRVAVQIGKDSGFVLGESSTLVMRRFDEAGVELVVDGAISVDLTHRAPGQRFVVIAGLHTVEVRGTAFRVERRASRTGVTCRHGRVVVSDGAHDVAVSGGEGIWIDPGADLSALRPEILSSERLAKLVDRVPLLPAWAGPAATFATSAPLQIGASTSRRVSIDGVDMGTGAMTVRVMSGRHLVEGDEWPRGEWIDATAASSSGDTSGGDAAGAGIVAVTPPKARTSSSARSKRLRELHADIDLRRIDGCLRALRKQGVAAGAFIELDIGIEASGAVSHLNIADTNLPASSAACVRDVVESVSFGKGERAEVRERFVF